MIYVAMKLLLSTYIFGICLVGVVQMIIRLKNYGNNSEWFVIPNIVILGVLGLTACVIATFLWVLFFYHIFLIAKNQTTVEYLKTSKTNILKFHFLSFIKSSVVKNIKKFCLSRKKKSSLSYPFRFEQFESGVNLKTEEDILEKKEEKEIKMSIKKKQFLGFLTFFTQLVFKVF